MKKPQLNKQALKYGSIATALTAIFIAVVIFINAIAVILVDRYPLRIDLTEENLFHLENNTVEYLQNMPQEIEIIVLMDEVYFTASSGVQESYQARQALYVMREFEQKSNGKVSLTFNQSLLDDVNFTSQYELEEFELGDVIIQTKEQPEEGKVTNFRHVSINDFFSQTTYSEYTYDISKVEQVISSAILYLNTGNEMAIGLVTGHNEGFLQTADDSTVKSLIRSNVYSVVQGINLGTDEEIDEDVTVLMIVNPKTDFTQEELKRLDEFLENGEQLGRGLMVFLTPNTPDLPNLEMFLEEWGITVGDGIVYETDAGNYYNSNILYPRVGYNNSDIFSTELSSSSLNLASPMARPIYAAEEIRNGVSASAVLSTYSTAKLMESAAGTTSEDDESGPFDVMVIGTKERTINNQSQRSSVLVSGSTAFLESTLLTSTSFSNDSGLISMINYLAQRDPNELLVQAKDMTTATLDITQAQGAWMAVIFIIVLPVAVVIVGIVVFVRRRHL